jgi:hypothetical protein
MNNGATTLPAHRNIDKIGNLYLDAWYDIVVGKHWCNGGTVPKRDFIQKVLETIYAPEATKILEN